MSAPKHGCPDNPDVAFTITDSREPGTEFREVEFAPGDGTATSLVWVRGRGVNPSKHGTPPK